MIKTNNEAEQNMEKLSVFFCVNYVMPLHENRMKLTGHRVHSDGAYERQLLLAINSYP